MAKKTLPTNYKDDVLANTMSEKRRYREIQNTDGTVSFEDVTDYTQIGSTFGAGQINEINTAVNNSFDASKIIDDYDTLLANTKSGYAAGALAVKELNSNLKKTLLRTTVGTFSLNSTADASNSYDVSSTLSKLGLSVSDITLDNFAIEVTSASGRSLDEEKESSSLTIGKTYTNGTVKVYTSSRVYGGGHYANASVGGTIYLLTVV